MRHAVPGRRRDDHSDDEGSISSDDEGSISLMVLVYFLVAGLLVVVVVAASMVHLERGRLLDLADAAALEAADAIEGGALFDGRLGGAVQTGGGVPVGDAEVRAAAWEYAEAAGGPTEFDDFAVLDSGTGTPDGQTAVVRVRATVTPPLVGLIGGRWRDGIPLEVTGRARGSLQGD